MPPASSSYALSGPTRRDPAALLLLAALLILARVGAGVYERLHAPEPMDRVTWHALKGAAEDAKAAGRPLLYDFSADWCGPCQRMKAEIFADKEGARLVSTRFTPVQVVDRLREEGKNPAPVEELQARYGVNSFPTLVIVPPDGGEPAILVGYSGKRQTLDALRQAVARSAGSRIRMGGGIDIK